MHTRAQTRKQSSVLFHRNCSKNDARSVNHETFDEFGTHSRRANAAVYSAIVWSKWRSERFLPLYPSPLCFPLLILCVFHPALWRSPFLTSWRLICTQLLYLPVFQLFGGSWMPFSRKTSDSLHVCAPVNFHSVHFWSKMAMETLCSRYALCLGALLLTKSQTDFGSCFARARWGGDPKVLSSGGDKDSNFLVDFVTLSAVLTLQTLQLCNCAWWSFILHLSPPPPV